MNPKIEIDRQAPAVGTSQILVNAPLRTVWTVLTDLNSWPEWNGNVSKMEFDGELKTGNTFTWKAGSRIVSRFELLEPPFRVVWSGKTLGIRAVHAWELHEQGEGTLIRTEESFDGLVVRLLRPVMKKVLHDTLKRALLDLKKEAESRAAG